MGMHDLVCETEAANLAGVSRNTLGRFAEAGYLKIETDNEGLRFYSIKELEDLFGFENSLKNGIERCSNDDAEDQRPQSEDCAASEREDASPAIQSDDEKVYHAEVLMADGQEDADHESRADQEQAETIETIESRHESMKLKTIVRLQEKILDMKDDELRSLRRECEWLRARIERYEEKNDRDQLLLLAETQMIRRFVALQTQKKPSPLRLALEWIGLAAPARAEDPHGNRSPAPIYEPK